ncbi:MAG: hypothetical protein IJ093_00850 [Bacilli bacterium]|nr:hypothetical protein [Bacilli bacterium]
MEEGMSKEKVVGMIFVLVIIILLALLAGFITNKNKRHQQLQNQIVTHQKYDISAKVNGNCVVYASLKLPYVEKGITAYYKSKNISNNVNVTYYYDGRQVADIDLKQKGVYLIEYYITNDDDTKHITIHRAVVVTK